MTFLYWYLVGYFALQFLVPIVVLGSGKDEPSERAWTAVCAVLNGATLLLLVLWWP